MADGNAILGGGASLRGFSDRRTQRRASARIPQWSRYFASLYFIVAVCGIAPIKGQEVVPPEDSRLTHFRSTDNRYTPVSYKLEEWSAKAKDLRRHILMCNGLWPMPEKTPLKTRVMGRIVREGYSVEKVAFESYAGLYVTGNLYRPAGKKGPFPAILSPHGHWENGRLENSELGSVPGRAINMALQGYVVLSYSMIGYNDSRQLTHRFDTKVLQKNGESIYVSGERYQLWGFSPMGLQLWNSIRAVDFLETLPDVDMSRVGITGASGGGTQAFMVAAVEPRIKVAAPVNMVSAHFQGGCVCENAPSLRRDIANVEIAALMAPRPLLLVSATGDWTNETLEVEYPAIREIYRLFGAEDKVKAVRFNYPHNYNRESRETVYAWFGQWLLGEKDPGKLKEKSFVVEKPEDLLIDEKVLQPAGIDEKSLFEQFVGRAQGMVERVRPGNAADILPYREEFGWALRDALGVEQPEPCQIVSWSSPLIDQGAFLRQRVYISRKGRQERSPLTLLFPRDLTEVSNVLLIVHPGGADDLLPRDDKTVSSILLRQNKIVAILHPFPAGFAYNPPLEEISYFSTYNRSITSHRVQDVLTAIAYLNQGSDIETVDVVGLQEAGLWVLLGVGLARGVRSVAVDFSSFAMSDEAFVERLFVPLVRKAGDFKTAAVLCTPRPLFVFNAGKAFPRAWFTQVYRAANHAERLKVMEEEASLVQVSDWLRSH